MPTAQIAENPAASLLSHVQIIDPDFGWWRGNRQLKNTKTSVGGETLDEEIVTKPQLKLMESTPQLQTYNKKFKALQQEHTKIIAHYTQEFPVSGLRMVPVKKIRDLLYELVGLNEHGTPIYDTGRHVTRTGSIEQSIAYRHAALTNEFCDDWAELRQSMANALPASVWKVVCDRIPHNTDIRKHFYVRVTCVDMQLSPAREEAEARGVLTSNDLIEYKAYIDRTMQEQIDQAITTIVAQPRQALADALRTLNELIARDGRVTDRSFNAVREAVGRLRNFSFAANSELLQQLNGLERRIADVDVGTITADNNHGLVDYINDVQVGVLNNDRIAADIASFGQAARGLRL